MQPVWIELDIHPEYMLWAYARMLTCTPHQIAKLYRARMSSCQANGRAEPIWPTRRFTDCPEP